MSSAAIFDITVPVYTRQLLTLQAILRKAQKWCADNGKPEEYLTEASLTSDMKPLPFQIFVCSLMVRSGVFGPQWKLHSPHDEPPYGTDFASMLSRVQDDLDWLQTFQRGSEGNAESLKYTYWLAGTPGEGDVVRFSSASSLLMQYIFPNFYFHMTTAYDICRQKGVPLGKIDFLLSAGMFG